MPRRKKQPETVPPDDSPQQIAPALAAVMEKANLITADQLPITATHVERHRPDGPKKRAPGEPFPVFVSVEGGFKLLSDGKRRFFKFDEDRRPADEQKAAMKDAGLRYQTYEKIWAAPNTEPMREATDRLALRFSGKAEGQGR